MKVRDPKDPSDDKGTGGIDPATRSLAIWILAAVVVFLVLPMVWVKVLTSGDPPEPAVGGRPGPHEANAGDPSASATTRGARDRRHGKVLDPRATRARERSRSRRHAEAVDAAATQLAGTTRDREPGAAAGAFGGGAAAPAGSAPSRGAGRDVADGSSSRDVLSKLSDFTRWWQQAAESPPRAAPGPSRGASQVREETGRAAAAAEHQAQGLQGSPLQGPGTSEPDLQAEDPLDDPLERHLSISGRVLNVAGEPLVGIEVIGRATRLFQVDEATAIPPSLREQRTWSGADGSYEFRQLADGEYVIGTTATDQYSSARIVVRAGVSFADLVLAQRALRVHGAIVSNAGQPLSGVRVAAMLSGARASLSNQEGRYELQLMLEETTRSVPIRFEREGYHVQQLQLEEADWRGISSLALDVSMEPVEGLGVVAGSVRSAAGEPVAGETVQLYSPHLKRSRGAATDQNGKFSIPKVEIADDYRLWVRPKGPYRDYTEEGLRVTADGLHVDIVLEPLGLGSRLSGQMMDVEGNAIPNFTLRVRSKDAVRQSTQVTGDDQGHFVVEDAPGGELVFETRSMPQLIVSGVHLDQGTERHLSLVLDWGPYELGGVVVDGEDNPVPVPAVYLSWTHDDNGVRSYSSRKTAADANGIFLFTGLGPGRHTLSINVPGFKSTRLEHDVGYEGNDVVVRLEDTSP